MFSLPRRLTPICSVDLSETIDDFKVVDLRPIQIAKLNKKRMDFELEYLTILNIIKSFQSMNRKRHKIKTKSWNHVNILRNHLKLTLEIVLFGPVMMDLNSDLSGGLGKSEMTTMMLYSWLV